MKLPAALFATGVALLVSLPAHATLIASSDYALDTLTGLEWLSPTLTVGLSYNQVQAGAGGWTAAGWKYATVDQFVTLATEYLGPADEPGGPTFYQGVSNDYFDGAKTVVVALQPNFSFNYPSPDDTTGSAAHGLEQFGVEGFLNGGGPGVGLGEITAVAVAGTGGYSGALDGFNAPLGRWGYDPQWFANGDAPDYVVGSFLVRADVSAVPLPGAAGLLGLALLPLVGVAGRGRSRRRLGAV